MVQTSFVLALSVVCARRVYSVKRGKVQVKGTKGHRSRLLGYITVKRTETLPGRWPIIIYTWIVDSVTLLIRLSSDVAHLRQMELPNTFDFTRKYINNKLLFSWWRFIGLIYDILLCELIIAKGDCVTVAFSLNTNIDKNCIFVKFKTKSWKNYNNLFII